MKKRFFYASLLLAAATLNSCSQDSDLAADEAATAAAGALTPEQKAQIMELAEYYDLDVTIDGVHVRTSRQRGSYVSKGNDKVGPPVAFDADDGRSYIRSIHDRRKCPWLLDEFHCALEGRH